MHRRPGQLFSRRFCGRSQSAGNTAARAFGRSGAPGGNSVGGGGDPAGVPRFVSVARSRERAYRTERDGRGERRNAAGTGTPSTPISHVPGRSKSCVRENEEILGGTAAAERLRTASARISTEFGPTWRPRPFPLWDEVVGARRGRVPFIAPFICAAQPSHMGRVQPPAWPLYGAHN